MIKLEIKKIKENTDTPLIGFAGGAWTTLFYCLYKKEERQKLKPEDVSKKSSQIDNLIERMTNAIIQHAEMQIDCGVNAFQIFESAAEHLSDEQFQKWCVTTYKKKIIEKLKRQKKRHSYYKDSQEIQTLNDYKKIFKTLISSTV